MGPKMEIPTINIRSVDTVGEKQINLAALQRIDAFIVEIVDNASQVALYKYSISSDEWEEPGIKGSFFLYKRSRVPYHGFVIMNRISTTNLVEPFIRGLDFIVKDPYLLYKNSTNNIFGIWFYEGKEFMRITSHIHEIVKAMKGKARTQRQRYASESALPKTSESVPQDTKCLVPNIITLLSNAQTRYERENSGGSNSATNNASIPVTLGDSTADLFPKLTSSETVGSAKNKTEPPVLPHGHKQQRQRFSSFDESDCNYFQNGAALAAAAHSAMPKDANQESLPPLHNWVDNKTLDEKGNSGFCMQNLPASPPKRLQNVESSVVSFCAENSTEPSSSANVTTIPPLSDKGFSEFRSSSTHTIQYTSCQTQVSEQQATALYEKQLGQALIHLLSNEPNMLAKIHRAYISSLNSHIDALSSS